MLWFLVALILGSLGFAASTGMNYKEILDALQPKLRDLQERVEKLKVAIKNETVSVREDEEKRATLHALIDEKKLAVSDMKRQVQAAEKEQESLEMDLQMNEFKKYK